MLPPPPRPASSGMAPGEQISSAWTSSGTRQICKERCGFRRWRACRYPYLQFSDSSQSVSNCETITHMLFCIPRPTEQMNVQKSHDSGFSEDNIVTQSAPPVHQKQAGSYFALITVVTTHHNRMWLQSGLTTANRNKNKTFTTTHLTPTLIISTKLL